MIVPQSGKILPPMPSTNCFIFYFQLLVSTTLRFSPTRVIFPRFEAMAIINPPQPAPQLGPQPDFARLTQAFQKVITGFQEASAELGNFANLLLE
jgi:hypothetical protein